MKYNKFYSKDKWSLVNEKNKKILEDYILECTSRKIKPTTLYQYRNDIRILFIWILEKKDNKVITDLVKKDFRDYILYLSIDKNLSNARVNRLMSCCRSLLSFLEDDEDYDYLVSQAHKIKGLPRDPVREIFFLDNEEVIKLYNYFMINEQYKDATLLGLVYESAGRKNELVQVKKDSIKEDKNCTNIVIGKRGKKFNLLYFKLTQNACKRYLKQRGEDNIEELFVTEDGKPASADVIYDWIIGWRKIYKDIFGKELNFNVHSFRHSSLENYANGSHEVCKKLKLGKIPLEKLRLIANHSSIATTQGYLRDNSERELEELFHIKLK